MSQIDLQIGHKIKTKRRKMGITQANLAKKLSISPSYLNLIESGRRKVNVDLLLKLANELGIEISDISKKTDTNLYQNLMDLLGDNLFEGLDITNFDLSLNEPCGYVQLTFQIQNNGDAESLENEFKIRPCVHYRVIDWNNTLITYNFPEQFLEGLAPGEYTVIETENELVFNCGNGIWEYDGNCTSIY